MMPSIHLSLSLSLMKKGNACIYCFLFLDIEEYMYYLLSYMTNIMNPIITMIQNANSHMHQDHGASIIMQTFFNICFYRNF